MTIKPAPDVSPLGLPYWEAAKRRELHLQRCVECKAFNSHASRWCSTCLCPDVRWTRVSGRGTLQSFSIVHMPPTAAFAEDAPYAIGIIALDEGAQLMTNVVDVALASIRVGMAVKVTFEERAGGFLVPQFAPVSD